VLRAEIRAALWCKREITEPVIELLCSDCSNRLLTKSLTKAVAILPQALNIPRGAPVSLLRLNDFILEFRDRSLAAPHALLVIDKKGDCLIDVRIVFRQLVPCRNDIGHFPLR